jgi:endonuclease/exonuclease/phosphatase (EEP) superfamily protein YafD
VRRGVSWVAALILTAVALPSLLARMAGGRAPSPGPELASLSPVAVLPAVVAVLVAATGSWWLAVSLAVPAALLVGVQLPPRRPRRPATAGPIAAPGLPGTSGPCATPGPLTIRFLTVNVLGGRADPDAVVRLVREHDVGVLAVQELTADMARKLKDADLPGQLPFSHADPRPAASGTGLWSRWPLTPLAPVPDTIAAFPRAQINPDGRQPVTLTAVHPKAPLNHYQEKWQQELRTLRQVLAGTRGPQIVAGDFNATRDHRPFRDLLSTGLVDSGDTAVKRPWPGFTWPSIWPGFLVKVHPPILPFMRLDHVLISRDCCTAREVRIIRVPGTDHCAVLAVIDLS